MPKNGKRQEGKNSSWMEIAVGLTKGCAVALGTTILLLFGCAAAVSARWLGQQTMERCVVMACVIGALVGAAVAMQNHRDWAMPLGIGTGGGLFLLLLTAGILFYENAPIPSGMTGIFCACLCGGGITGILGRKTKKKRRR